MHQLYGSVAAQSAKTNRRRCPAAWEGTKEGHGFKRCRKIQDSYQVTPSHAAEKLGFVSGHGFSRAAQTQEKKRASAPEVRALQPSKDLWMVLGLLGTRYWVLSSTLSQKHASSPTPPPPPASRSQIFPPAPSTFQ